MSDEKRGNAPSRGAHPSSLTMAVIGHGEMANLVRAYDWTSTPLGLIDIWSETTVSTVNVVLSSPFPSAVFWGADLVSIYNDAYRSVAGMRHPGALGQYFREIWTEAWHLLGPQAGAAFAEGVTIHQENFLLPLHRDGRVQDFYWTYSFGPVYEKGKIAGILLTLHDTTKAVLVERERDAVNEQMRGILESTTDAVLATDREWRITYLNHRAREILGLNTDLTGKSIWDSYPSLQYPGSPYIKHFHRAMYQHIAAEFVAYYPEPLNAWFSLLVQPLADGIIIFFRDITEQRRKEEALRESEARLSAIYSTSHAYIGLIAPDGTILDCNRASLQFAGNTREELVGKCFWDAPWFSGTPGASALVRQGVNRAAAGQFIRYEAPLIRPSGETMTFDFSLSPVFDAYGAVAFVVPEGHDITGLKRTEAALMQSEKLAAVGRLAGSIAHEINNPLESVTNLLYLARSSPQLPLDIQGYLDTAERELRRVSDITSQTLRFHKQSTKPRMVLCDDLIEGALGIYRRRLADSRVKVKRRNRTTKPILCFEGEIRQVLTNLIGNAIDAMPPDGGQLLLRVREATDWASDRKGVMLTAADTGGGISPSVAKRIFEPFFTTKGLGGTGLGLWVSKEIVARHNGTIHVRSSQRPGSSGTVFTLFLPFDAVTRQDWPPR